MAIYQYFFLPQNLKKITEEKCLAITEKKKKELKLLREKINEQLVKDEKLIQKYTKDGLISSPELSLLEQSKKNRLGAYNLILQLQDKILSNHILSAQWFPNTSKTKTTRVLSQTEINNFLDVITVLSLSIEISEILYGALDEKNVSHPQDELSEKIEHFAMKVYSLPNNGNDFLNKISTELMHLAIACVTLCTCFFMFATISHFALIAAAVYVCTGLSFFGISEFIQFTNQKTENVSLLIDIINYFKYQDLKFNFDSISMEIPNKSFLSNTGNLDSSENSILSYTEGFELHNLDLRFESIYIDSEENSLNNTDDIIRLALKFSGRTRVDSNEPDRHSIPSQLGSLKSDISSDESDDFLCGPNVLLNCADYFMSDNSSIESKGSNGKTPNNHVTTKDSEEEWEFVGAPVEATTLSDNKLVMFNGRQDSEGSETSDENENTTSFTFKGYTNA